VLLTDRLTEREPTRLRLLIRWTCSSSVWPHIGSHGLIDPIFAGSDALGDAKNSGKDIASL